MDTKYNLTAKNLKFRIYQGTDKKWHVIKDKQKITISKHESREAAVTWCNNQLEGQTKLF